MGVTVTSWTAATIRTLLRRVDELEKVMREKTKPAKDVEEPKASFSFNPHAEVFVPAAQRWIDAQFAAEVAYVAAEVNIDDGEFDGGVRADHLKSAVRHEQCDGPAPGHVHDDGDDDDDLHSEQSVADVSGNDCLQKEKDDSLEIEKIYTLKKDHEERTQRFVVATTEANQALQDYQNQLTDILEKRRSQIVDGRKFADAKATLMDVIADNIRWYEMMRDDRDAEWFEDICDSEISFHEYTKREIEKAEAQTQEMELCIPSLHKKEKKKAKGKNRTRTVTSK